MEVYKEMYFKLIAAQTDAIVALQAILEQLLQAHRQAEHMLINANERIQPPKQLKDYSSFRSLS